MGSDDGFIDAPAEDLLVHCGNAFVNFRNRTFQWVDIKVFELPDAPIDDSAVLALLLRHVRYRDSYAGTEDADMVDIHGPYRLDVIGKDTFVPTVPAAEETVLREWAEQSAPLPDSARDDLERELYHRIHNTTSMYRLPDLGKDAFHSWGSVLGLRGFHELVLIDRVANQVALVVATDD